ncbi:MAG: lipocalin family protein [Candidatus Marinimicrobia bacterium]|nr:lipocalin family protein [Candidatus Neomarinimicrobiota bacterium]
MPTVDEVDLEQYKGKWYEIARLNHRFERGLTNVTAEYSLKPDGKIQVVNSGYKESPQGKFSTITGKAWVPDENEPGRLKVSFFWWFSSDYNIVALDPDYQHALVTGPNRNYLWILSRSPQMDENVYNDLLELAQQNGFPTQDLIKVIQNWE